MRKKQDAAQTYIAAPAGQKEKKTAFQIIEPYLYLLPAMILFVIFVFYPFKGCFFLPQMLECENNNNRKIYEKRMAVVFGAVSIIGKTAC